MKKYKPTKKKSTTTYIRPQNATSSAQIHVPYCLAFGDVLGFVTNWVSEIFLYVQMITFRYLGRPK